MGTNICSMVGRLTANPKQVYPNGEMITVFNIAIESEQINSTGTTVKIIDYPRIEVYGKLGQAIYKYKKKGDQISIVGSTRTRRYQKDGETRFIQFVQAAYVEFLANATQKMEKEEKRIEENG